MKCKLCDTKYPIEDPIRRTCGNHSDRKYKERAEGGVTFLRIISRNYSDPIYQMHSHDIFPEEEGNQSYYSQLWFGF